MIYQLMRRDMAWKAMPWLALASAVFWICPSPVDMFCAFLLPMILLGVFPLRRATRFEAALPIAGRELAAARILSMLAMIWAGAAAGTASLAARNGLSARAAGPLEVAAVCTLMVGVAQSPRLKLLAGPQWIALPLVIVATQAAVAVLHFPLALPAALAGLAGFALLARVCASAPLSYRLAPDAVEESNAAQDQAARLAAPIAWAPVVRSVCSWQYLFFTLMAGFLAIDGNWLTSPMWIVFAWWAPRPRVRWLWALPVGRRALLWTMIGPILGAQAAAYFAGFAFHRVWRPVAEPRVMAVTLGAILGCALLSILVCALTDWRKLLRIPYQARVVTLVVALFAFFVWGILGARNPVLVRDLVARFARALPLGLPALIAAVAVALAGLYWLVEKVFGEPDLADRPKASDVELPA